MRTTLLLFVLFIAVIGSDCSSLQGKPDERTGVDLLQECQIVADDFPADKSAEKGMMCLGYLNGVVDTYGFWNLWNEQSKQHSPAPVCIPEGGVTGFELAKVVVKFLNDNPNDLHRSYRVLVQMALKVAYPCNGVH